MIPKTVTFPRWLLALAAVAFVVGFLIGLSGCQRVGSSMGGSMFLRAYTDPDTRCQYLLYANGSSAALTPRMGADGKQVCVQP